MVRRSRSVSVAALAAVLAVAPALTGCAQVVRSGLGLLGIHQQPAGVEGRSVDRTPSAKADHDRPAATVGRYQSAPDYTWGGSATATPASFSHLFTSGPVGKACTIGSMGLARVLPVGIGAPAIGVERFGPITLGVAGPGVDALGQLWTLQEGGFARAAMRTTAQSGTWGSCGRGLFAFVSFGPGNAYEPVVVR